MTDDRALTQLRRGVLEHCVLALLAREQRYGYDLVRALGASPALGIAEGSIYPLLSRLRSDGLVATSWHESSGGPPRRYYALTAEGRRRLEAFRPAWAGFRDAVDQILQEAP
jgi:PadR family transcriptional regulator PadR